MTRESRGTVTLGEEVRISKHTSILDQIVFIEIRYLEEEFDREDSNG